MLPANDLCRSPLLSRAGNVNCKIVSHCRRMTCAPQAAGNRRFARHIPGMHVPANPMAHPLQPDGTWLLTRWCNAPEPEGTCPHRQCPAGSDSGSSEGVGSWTECTGRQQASSVTRCGRLADQGRIRGMLRRLAMPRVYRKPPGLPISVLCPRNSPESCMSPESPESPLVLLQQPSP